ncbi:hypothetical protein ACLBXX_10355 [Microbacterium sp. C23T]
MPLAALVMALVVLAIMLPVMIVAILWPGALARLNAAGIRNLPVAAPRSMREQAASNSTPGTMRFTGIAGLAILIVVGTAVTRTALERGVDEITPEASRWIVWPVYAIGIAQALFGLCLIIWSGWIFERLQGKFEKDGAHLRRWMIVVLGAVALVMAATSLFVAVSLG